MGASVEVKAGEFVLTNYGGYPYWTTIKYEGNEIAQIDHRELADLEYVVSRFRQLLKIEVHEREKEEV